MVLNDHIGYGREAIPHDLIEVIQQLRDFPCWAAAEQVHKSRDGEGIFEEEKSRMCLELRKAVDQNFNLVNFLHKGGGQGFVSEGSA
jgi:hypothetical protein